MSQEIELKFELDEASIKQLATFLQTQRIDEQHSLHLTNRYYDTIDNVLRRNRASIRIRSTKEQGKPNQYEITVKSSGDDKSIAGLHSRQEFNAPLPDERLNLSILPPIIFPSGLNIENLSKQLVALFSTDFQRKTLLICFNQSQIEVALDQGTISSGNSSLPILELELELKLGTKVDLLLFAQKLSQFNLHLFSQSKAARGYRLVQGSTINKIPELIINNLSLSSELSNILRYWQTNEEYALEYNDLNFYKQILDQVAEHITPILPIPQNEYSTELNQAYGCWLEQIKSISEVKAFAFSRINTQFKLYLMLLIL